MTSAYDSLMETLRARRSVRRFRPDPLPEGTVARLVEAARWAPTAGNRQAFRLFAVTAPTVRAAMAAAVESAVRGLRAGLRDDARDVGAAYLDNFTHFATAPLVLAPIHRRGVDLLGAVLAEGAVAPGTDGRADLDAVASVSAAIDHVLLAAHALGLGACWMTGPLVAADALAALLEVPQGWALSALVPVGYAADVPPPPPRREARRLVREIA